MIHPPSSPDPQGWFGWYCKYTFGRRIEEEEDRQIKRWLSFVARHNAQAMKGCKKGDHECRPTQRQALLQWGWDSDTPFDDKQRSKNLKRLLSIHGASLESKIIDEALSHYGYK